MFEPATPPKTFPLVDNIISLVITLLTLKSRQEKTPRLPAKGFLDFSFANRLDNGIHTHDTTRNELCNH